MNCDACGNINVHYYITGKIKVCETCIKGTYLYKELESKKNFPVNVKHESHESNTFTDNDYKSFNVHEKCKEFDSICNHRERLLEKIYYDIDKLKWEIDSDLFKTKKKK